MVEKLGQDCQGDVRVKEAFSVVETPRFLQMMPGLRRMVVVFPDTTVCQKSLVEAVYYDLISFGKANLSMQAIGIGLMAAREVVGYLAKISPTLTKVKPNDYSYHRRVAEQYFWMDAQPADCLSESLVATNYKDYLLRIKPQRKKSVGLPIPDPASPKGRLYSFIRKWGLVPLMQQLDQAEDSTVVCILHSLGYSHVGVTLGQFCQATGISWTTYGRRILEGVDSFKPMLVRGAQVPDIRNLAARVDGYKAIHSGIKMLDYTSVRLQIIRMVKGQGGSRLASNRIYQSMTEWEKFVFGQTGTRLADGSLMTANQIAEMGGKWPSQVHEAWAKILGLYRSWEKRIVDTQGVLIKSRVFPAPIIRLLEEYGAEYFDKINPKYKPVFELIAQGLEARRYPNESVIRATAPEVDDNFIRDMQVYFRRFVKKSKTKK